MLEDDVHCCPSHYRSFLPAKNKIVRVDEVIENLNDPVFMFTQVMKHKWELVNILRVHPKI